MPPSALRAATLAELQKSREIYATSPAGHTYKIRPLNLTKYALAGFMPASLRAAALEGAKGVNAVLGGTEDVLSEHGPEMSGYLDALVRQVVVEPDVGDADLDLIPPVDYAWLVRIALMEEDRDGEGRLLWGREALSTWATFRHEHGCAEDCPECARLVLSVANLQ